MKDFKGKLNDQGLSSFNQRLFDSQACFNDAVWIIDINKEMVEVLHDNIMPDAVGRHFTLEEIRAIIRNRYPSENRNIVSRYTTEYLSSLKSTVYFNSPTFIDKGRKMKLRQAMTPELDNDGNTVRVYVTCINIQNFLTSRSENTDIYKTVSMILSHGKDAEESINDTLSYIGNTLNVSRIYIFENDPEDPAYGNNTFEWCAEGMPAMKDALQHISYDDYGYSYIFANAQLYACQDCHAIEDEFMRDLFANQGIKAFINYAFYDNDQFAGFIGIDDCRMSRTDWDDESEEIEVLTFVADLLSTYLIKERNLIKAKESEAKEKEMRLKDLESRTLLTHFVESYTSAYSVNLIERSFKILHMAHDFQQVFTMNGSMDDMARYVENHVHPDDRPLMRKMTDPDHIRMIMREQKEISFTLREQYEGVEKTMHAIIIRGIDADHVAIGFMDVSAEVQKEKEINEQLEAANNAKRDFLSAMSHDIRTPMNAILGMVGIARNHVDDKDKVVDCLDKITVSGNQLLSLINDVLDISAIESGKTILRPAIHSVQAGADTTRNTIQGILAGKNLDVTISQHDVIHPWIMVDEARLSQIANNLLSNAIKYTPEGGKVSLDNYQETDEYGNPWNVIVVSDTGIGMSEEFMEKMWDTFSRATDTRINKIQGAGLGLSIVRSLIEMMGGTISVQSELDKGSTFTVMIPIIPAQPEIVEAKVINITDNISLHVLLAEDNNMNWEIASELLEMKGVTCDRAVNGQEAVNMFNAAPQGTYDAILMDMQMPIMDGLEATRVIRASDHPQAKTIPIIAMTANAFTEDMEQCIAAGMNEHLAKPIDIDKVIEALQTYTR